MMSLMAILLFALSFTVAFAERIVPPLASDGSIDAGANYIFRNYILVLTRMGAG